MTKNEWNEMLRHALIEHHLHRPGSYVRVYYLLLLLHKLMGTNEWSRQ